MRITLPQHHLSVDPSSDWIADEMDPEAMDRFGLYLRSAEHGVYLNARSQEPGNHPLTKEGLLAILREQNWASPPFDEWTSTPNGLTAVGGSFETVGMGGEVVLEVFATDGRSLVNLAGPGERTVIRALMPAVRRLVNTLQFID